MPSKRFIAVFFLIIVFVCGLWVLIESRPPADFAQNTEFNIEKGEGVSAVAQDLADRHIIRSPLLFKIFVVLLGKSHRIISEDYLFKSPISVIDVAKKITRGDTGFVSLTITIPEGFNSTQIASLFGSDFFNFSQSEFLLLTKEKEGYLFPDTYFFKPSATAADVIEKLEDNFKTKVASIQKDIDAFGKSEDDVITMASILEGEANTQESRSIVAGILWKRLSIGMPLQVDATLTYATGRTTYELTSKDLKTASPYNTYTHKGLPPTPINNPGVDTILATVHPVKTAYFYYLTDKNGGFHYAVTYDEHLKNKFKYLR